MSPKVSIIIPVYNVEKYLRQCLDSVCNQTYRNLEIICINDGSTDESPAILQEYEKKDTRIKVITQSNSGLASARNTGLMHATGEWVGGIDSDDYFDLTTIERCVQHIHDDVDVIHFGFKWFSETKQLDDSWTHLKFSGKIEMTEDLIPKLFPHFVDKLWRRSFLQSYGVSFPLGLHFEDLCYSWRLLAMARYIYCIPDKLYYYRFRDDSIMGSHVQKKGGRKILDFLELSDICLAFWQKNNIRKRFDCHGPAYIELEILNRSRDRITRWATDDLQYEAWFGIRALIEKYNLGSRLHEFTDLALYYYLPPFIYKDLLRRFMWWVDQRKSQHSDKNEIKNMSLLLNERKIYWEYRKVQLLAHLTWGEKHRAYKEKKRRYHNLLRKCRQLKKHFSNIDSLISQ